MNGKYRSKIGKIFSDYNYINYEVPEGTVLGPILILTYINGISKAYKLLYFIMSTG